MNKQKFPNPPDLNGRREDGEGKKSCGIGCAKKNGENQRGETAGILSKN